MSKYPDWPQNNKFYLLLIFPLCAALFLWKYILQQHYYAAIIYADFQKSWGNGWWFKKEVKEK